jgi:hypothetical protein
MNQKYVDSLPLYHQEKQIERLGIELSRQHCRYCAKMGGKPIQNLTCGSIEANAMDIPSFSSTIRPPVPASFLSGYKGYIHVDGDPGKL